MLTANKPILHLNHSINYKAAPPSPPRSSPGSGLSAEREREREREEMRDVASSSKSPAVVVASGSNVTQELAKMVEEGLPAPPASLHDIIRAYKSNGGGDRELLLALLKAKVQEDERLTTVLQTRLLTLQMQAYSLAASRNGLVVEQRPIGSVSIPPTSSISPNSASSKLPVDNNNYRRHTPAGSPYPERSSSYNNGSSSTSSFGVHRVNKASRLSPPGPSSRLSPPSLTVSVTSPSSSPYPSGSSSSNLARLASGLPSPRLSSTYDDSEQYPTTLAPMHELSHNNSDNRRPTHSFQRQDSQTLPSLSHLSPRSFQNGGSSSKGLEMDLDSPPPLTPRDRSPPLGLDGKHDNEGHVRSRSDSRTSSNGSVSSARGNGLEMLLNAVKGGMDVE